jgi:hypothetical protein
MDTCNMNTEPQLLYKNQINMNITKKLLRKADSEPDGLAPEQRPPRRHARHAARLQHRQDRLRRPQPLHGGPGHTVHPQ